MTPRGLTRRANRPFRQLFSPQLFSDLDLKRYKRISSAEALIRRLDDLSCQGCHQSRSIAGFHLIGEDDGNAAPGNAAHVARSPHLVAELTRRQALVAAVARAAPLQTAKPFPLMFDRPFAERSDNEPGGLGARCGTGDVGFATWTCAPGYQCVSLDGAIDDRAVGTCTPAGAMTTGGPCEIGPIRAHANAHRDRIKSQQMLPCADDGACNTNRVGFPLGMCATSCENPAQDVACGSIALLTPFNNCLAKGTPFPLCLSQHVAPAGLRACSESTPCRDDYICSRTSSGRGACIPPYFLFQLRVDGHP